MKKSNIYLMLVIFLTLSLQAITQSSFAQAPQKMSYQAVIRNSANQLVTNKMVGMRISILQGSESGTAVYTETQTPTTNANGLATIEIGTGNTSNDFATIDWAIGPYFIKTESDPSGETNYTIVGESQLLSVPYALYANSSENVTDATLSGKGTATTPLKIAQQGATTGQALKWNGTSWLPANDENGLWTKNGYNAYYNSGNVGIGTSTPQNNLQIHSSSVYSGLFLTNDATGTTSSDGLILGLQHQSDAPTNRYAVLLNRENSSFQIGTNDLYQLTLTPQGYVGIGTTDPKRNLHINSSSVFASIHLTNDASGTTASDGLSIGLQYQSDAPTNRYSQIINNENCPLYLGSNGNHNLTIAADGKIGIGTSAPGAALHIKGSGYPNSFIIMEGEGKSDAGFRLNEGISTKWHIFNSFSAGGLQIYNSAAITAIFCKQSNSFVGINTTTPNYNLEVNGTAGKTGGGSWSNSSDIRLKNVLGNYNKGLNEIAALQPILFKYKEGNARNLPFNQEQIGFVAQDVQKIFPEAITNADDGYLDFNIHAINVALVNAVKELKAENDQLKAENGLLKSKVEQIDSRLANIESLVSTSAMK
jgi:hypothetical protein